MPMNDWKVTNYVDPEHEGESWVYKESAKFPNLHMSCSVDHPDKTHVATDDRTAYYYGDSGTFNRNDLSEAVKNKLKAAWADHYTVSDEKKTAALAAAFEHARTKHAKLLTSATADEQRWSTPLTNFETKQRDVQLSFDYNPDKTIVSDEDEGKLRFVMQVVQQQATNKLASAGVDFTNDSETWIQFFARYPLLFNFRGRSKKHIDEKEFSLGVNTKLVSAAIDAKAPEDIKSAFIQALQDAGGEVLKTTTKTTHLQYLTLVRSYSKASTLTIYRAQLDMETKIVKTLCGGTARAHLVVDYDQVDFEINNTLALGLYDALVKVAVDEAVAFMTSFFKLYAKQEFDRFDAWLKSLGQK